MKNFKKIICVLLALVITLSACSGGGNQSGSIIIGITTEPVTMDTFGSNDAPSSLVSSNIYDTLTVLDNDGVAQPSLATEWTQDGTDWTFKLRDDVVFHNGEKMTSEDVVFSINSVLESEKVAYVLEEVVTGVEAIDEYTVKFSTPAPTNVLPLYLTHDSTGIQNKLAYESGDVTEDNPVGSGPYKFVSWTTGSEIKLEKFSDYWGETAKNDGLEFRLIPEASTLLSALQAGEIDVINDVQASDVDIFDTNDDITLLSEPSYSYDYFGFNFLKEDAPHQDVRVRQAIAYAIDTQSIINSANVSNGQATQMSTAIPSTMPLYDAGLDPYPYDTEKAKQLLAEAGYPDGFEMDILTSESGVRPQIAQIIQSQLAEIGITVTVNSLEWGSFLEQVDAGTEDTYLLGWSSAVPDPNYSLYALFSSNTHGGSGNLSYYSNQTVDELFDAAKTTSDEQERIDLYVEVQKVLYDDLPHVPLFNENVLVGVRSNIKDVIVTPDSRPDYSQAVKE